MKILGVIAEFNPFHNGHKHLLAEAKAKVMPDYTISVMSGDFLQRGEAALFDKYTRTKMAILGGIDAVFELPAYYACASAEEFATAAVLAMKHLGVTHLAFGAECTDLDLLQEIAAAGIFEDEDFRSHLKKELARGIPYAKAYSSTICQYTKIDDAQALLSEPNNILAICYLKAILKHCPCITPVLIARTGAFYHETDITGEVASASAIRQSIIKNDTAIKEIAHTLPAATLSHIPTNDGHIMYLSNSDFSTALRYRILCSDASVLSNTYDISVDLANRIRQSDYMFMNYEALAMTLKTKAYTLTGINRALLHLLLQMQQTTFDKLKQNQYIFYIRLLGMSKECSALIKYQREYCHVPWIQKVSSDARALVSENTCPANTIGQTLFQSDMLSADLYRMIWFQKYGNTLPSDYETNAVIL